MLNTPEFIMLGNTASSVQEVSNEPADPADFPAGRAVRRASNGGLQLASNSVASLIGISLGESLSDTEKTAVCRTGNYVPIVLKNDAASVKIGDITFTAKLFGAAGNAITVTLVDDTEDGSANVEVDGTDIIVNMEATVTEAQDIVAAIEANSEANALLSCVIDPGDEAAAQAAASETSLTGGSDVAVIGTLVKVDATTGEASVDGDTTAAVYLSGPLTGVYKDGTTVPAAYIAMPGGL
jgi:hypothetical protein